MTSSPKEKEKQLHIVFLHLDLGIGGAEQLMVNLALASLPPPKSQKNGSSSDVSSQKYLNAKVSILTTHCNQSHCFDSVRHHPTNPGILSSSVHIYGTFIPVNIFGKGTVFFSTLRMLYLSFIAKFILFTKNNNNNADVFVLDVLPSPIPFLIWFKAKCVIYYCHFPDKLLKRDTINGISIMKKNEESGNINRIKELLKRIYRWIMDGIEEWSMSYADVCCVNSNFTKKEVLNAFPKLNFTNNNNENGENENDDNDTHDDDTMKVLYPAIDLNKFIPPDFQSKSKKILIDQTAPIVSLNRFERKKNIDVLLHAYSILLQQKRQQQNGKEDKKVKLPPLIISGGYDPRNNENVQYLTELKSLSHELGISEYTTFRPSISDDERAILLQSALCVVYTPHREHFGIVPLEAMYAGSAVIAGNSGGPKETVIHDRTGLLVEDMIPGKKDDDDDDDENDAGSKNLANALLELLENPNKAIEMGKYGHEHVSKKFGLGPFREQWRDIVLECAIPRGKRRLEKAEGTSSLLGTMSMMMIMIAFFVGIVSVLWRD